MTERLCVVQGCWDLVAKRRTAVMCPEHWLMVPRLQQHAVADAWAYERPQPSEEGPFWDEALSAARTVYLLERQRAC